MESTSNDPVDGFLAADFSPQPNDSLRQRLLQGTTRLLRCRRRWRRFGLVASWAACLALGSAATLWWRGSTSPASGPREENITRRPAPKETPLVPEDIAPPTELLQAVAKEWEAFDSAKNRAALFFAAGDRYLAEANDYQSAIRCYRQALDASAAPDLEISPSDNWLVTALKVARQKEKNDAKVH